LACHTTKAAIVVRQQAGRAEEQLSASCGSVGGEIDSRRSGFQRMRSGSDEREHYFGTSHLTSKMFLHPLDFASFREIFYFCRTPET
jgi:hypothetical protein